MTKYRVWAQGGGFYIERKSMFGWIQVYDRCIDEVAVPRCFFNQQAAEEHVKALMDQGKAVFP